MAINKVVAPNSVPTNVSDYVAQNAHMMGFMTQVNMQAFVLTDPTTADKPKVALGSYVAHGGSLYKVESGDETISGSPADGKVYVRVTGNATLSASFVSDISGYSYNHAYGTMTSGAYTLLPYEIRKSGSSWVKYRYDFLGTTDQDLRTTDAPTFATVNTGHGNNKVYKIIDEHKVVASTLSTTIEIPSIEIETIMLYAITFSNTITGGSGDRYLSINLPSEGDYLVINGGRSVTINQVFNSGMFNGGQTVCVFRISAGETITQGLIIKRIA